MTRINLVDPSELCDQHLLAEHRELTRIPNAVARGRFSLVGQPADYKLGEGHVRFFFDKLAFLQRCYAALHEECMLARRLRQALDLARPRFSRYNTFTSEQHETILSSSEVLTSL